MYKVREELPRGVHLLRRLRGPGIRIRHLCWAPDGERLAVGFENGALRIWDLERPDPLIDISTGIAPILHLAWSTDGDSLAIAGPDGGIEIWSARQEERLRSLSTQAARILGVAWVRNQAVLRVAMTVGKPPHGRIVLDLWDVKTGKRSAREDRNTWNRSYQAISENSRLLASCLASGRIEVFCMETGRRIADFPHPFGEIFSVEQSPDGQLLAVGLPNGSIRLWNMEVQAELPPVQLNEGRPVYSLSFSPDGRLLASKSREGGVRFKRCDTWDPVGYIPEAQVLLDETEIAFSSRPTFLATLDELNTAVRLWKIDVPNLLMAGGNSLIPILFLSADPAAEPARFDRCPARDLKTGKAPSTAISEPRPTWTRLRLDEELREIQAVILASKFRDRLYLQANTAARPEDLSRALLTLQPRIVHFSGHGGRDNAIYMEDRAGVRKRVAAQALVSIFKPVKGIVECVVLNACHSATQTKAISRHVPYVIGMKRAIDDRAAIAFSIGFYQAVGAGLGIPQAFDAGCAQIELQGIPQHLIPGLVQSQPMVQGRILRNGSTQEGF